MIDLISTAEAAKIVGLSKEHIQRLCLNGKIDGAQKIGKVYVIPRAWAEAYAAKNAASVSIKEAAELAGVTRQAIALAVNSGKLKKIDRRITRDSLERYIEKRKN